MVRYCQGYLLHVLRAQANESINFKHIYTRHCRVDSHPKPSAVIICSLVLRFLWKHLDLTKNRETGSTDLTFSRSPGDVTIEPSESQYLPPATKLGQGYIFTGVCYSVHSGGGGVLSQHALQVVSQHAL